MIDNRFENWLETLRNMIDISSSGNLDEYSIIDGNRSFYLNRKRKLFEVNDEMQMITFKRQRFINLHLQKIVTIVKKMKKPQ
jgi:hypothetical protein